MNNKNEEKRAKLSFASPIDVEYLFDPNECNNLNNNESDNEQNQVSSTSLHSNKPDIKILLITKKHKKLLENIEDQHQ